MALSPPRNRHAKQQQLPKVTVSNINSPTPTIIVTAATSASPIIHIHGATNRPLFGETTNNNNNKYQHYHQHQHTFTANEALKTNIKRVLDFEEKNETLDKYIMNSFNLYDADPVYMFILPGDHNNRTLVYRRSNFSEPIFPDIVPLKQLRKLSFASHQIAHQELYYDKKADKYVNDIPKVKYEQFKGGVYDLEEAASLKVIEENVRTERNFLEFMEDLKRDQENKVESEGRQLTRVSAKDNDGLNEYEVVLRNIHAAAVNGSTEKKQALLTGETRAEVKEFNRRRTTGVSWQEFGLDGWLGNLDAKYMVPAEGG